MLRGPFEAGNEAKQKLTGDVMGKSNDSLESF